MEAEATSDAWQIILEGRERVRNGGRLYSKGSGSVPSRLRACFLAKIDKSIAVTLKSEAAISADRSSVIIEHIVPMKRVAIEIINPDGHDPRTGGGPGLRPGPARHLAHAKEIAMQMIKKAFVTEHEHRRLNLASRSFQWAAPGGDGMARYRSVGIELFPIML